MLYDHKIARNRVQVFIDTVLLPARYRPVSELEIGVFQSAEPCSYAQAAGAKYEPARLGFRFGPAWSTAWFRLRGAVPAGTVLEQLVLLMDTNTEACVWKEGVPYHGLSRHHRYAPLDASFVQNGRVELLVEAAANQMFGITEWRPRTPDEQIGHLTEARLAVVQPEVDQLWHDMSFALQLVDVLDEAAPRRGKLLFALNAACNAALPNDLPGTAAAARAALGPVLRAPANASAGDCYATGHAHIDTAWLWPLRETRRKCYRTFSTALRNMERYPDYRFQASQAAQYEFIRQDAPEVFEQIRRRVASGQWDAGGGSWVECDCNLVSGESLVRQILYGTRYWQQHFGIAQSYLWLPDTFGYSAALPQILVQAGMRVFFTQKISWNQFNKFPHHTFWWAGLDGTKILAHFLTSDNYNANCSPKELRYSERAFKQSDRCNTWLYAFGWGDGGGGPTAEMIEMLRRSADCEEMPRARMATVREYVDVLHAEAQALPTWDGELYLELHRGTLTTQGANKRHNRKAELRLRDVELLHALPRPGADYPSAKLEQTWKTVLLNQFHDILPGSSIGWVYDDCARDYAQVDAALAELEQTGLQKWAAGADTSGAKHPVVAVNTLGWQRSGVVELPGEVPAETQTLAALGGETAPVQTGQTLDGTPARLGLVRDVPAVGHRVFDAQGGAAKPGFVPVRGTSATLENEWLRAEFDAAGRIVSLRDKRAQRELLQAGEPANQLVVYEDRPQCWDAWDIDVYYLEKGRPVAEPARVTLVEAGPLRATLRVEHALGQSRVKQDIHLTCASPRLDFETWVDWRGDHELLRVLFPLDLRSAHASYHTQFGQLQRTTHFNTKWDLGHFECCGHHWADLAEPDYGAALLSDCKYGYSCHGHVLGLSLLRAPTNPDPQADRGEHRFTYSLLPHTGDLRTGGVVQAGYDLNVPLRVVSATPHAGPRGATGSLLTCAAPNLVVDTVKKAEDDGRVIVRLYEAWGQRGKAVVRWDPALGSAKFVDLLESGPTPIEVLVERSAAGEIVFGYRPFGLYTLALG